jgi:hypothetical protein
MVDHILESCLVRCILKENSNFNLSLKTMFIDLIFIMKNYPTARVWYFTNNNTFIQVKYAE